MNDQPAPETPVVTPPPSAPNSFHAPVEPSSNLLAAVIAGLVAALAGAVAWAAVTAATKFQIGWMAVGVGFLVGLAVRKFGRGTTPVFGVAGAALALVGCLAGNLLATIGITAIEGEMAFFELFSQIPVSAYSEILEETFSPMDALFYAIAVFQGYKVSIATS